MEISLEDVIFLFYLVLGVTTILNKIVLVLNRHYNITFWSVFSDIFEMFDLAKETANVFMKIIYYTLALITPLSILLIVGYLVRSYYF